MFFFCLFFRFRDRILIPDKQTRECLKSFMKNDPDNIVSLKLLMLKNAPCMMKLLEFVAVHGRLTSEWREFVLHLHQSVPFFIPQISYSLYYTKLQSSVLQLILRTCSYYSPNVQYYLMYFSIIKTYQNPFLVIFYLK